MFRKCAFCRTVLVPAKPLGTEIYLCDNCKDEKEAVIRRILHERNINIDFFRMYDKDGKRLCIFCGDPTSKRSNTFCGKKDHNSMKYESEINRKYKFTSISYYYTKNECEICGKKYRPKSIFRSDPPGIQMNLHHIIPVHKLNSSNWLLCFDRKNMITLCENCHKLIHSKTENKFFSPDKPVFKKLDTFLVKNV